MKRRTFDHVTSASSAVLADGTAVQVPNVCLTKHLHGVKYKIKKGAEGWSTLIAFKGDKCIGWIDTQVLGYPNATAWAMGEAKNRREKKG